MRIRTQITLIICSIIIGLMSALGFIIYVKSAAILDKSAEMHMVNQLERVQENIDLRVKMTKLETQELSLDKKVEAFLEKKVSAREINAYLSDLLMKKNQLDNYYMDLFVMDRDGKIVASCMPVAMNIDLSTREYFKESVRKKETITSDILIARSNKALIVNTATPIIDADGRVMGYAGTAVYADYFSDVVKGLELGQTGFYAIVDSNNMILSHINRSLIGKPSVFNVTKELFSSDKIIKRVTAGRYDQREWQVFKKMNSNQWILVAVLPLKDIYYQSESLLISVTAIGLIAILLALILGTYVSRKISTPIEAMTDYMNIILKGATEFDKSLSESVHDLKRNYAGIEEEALESKMGSGANSSQEITKLNQSFHNFKKSVGAFLLNYEKENRNFMRTSEKMAQGVSDYYSATSKFILTLSHDLKNSITVIKGYSKGLKMGMIKDEAVKQEFIEAIYDRTEDLERIIYDVLDSAYEAQTKSKMNLIHVETSSFAEELGKSTKQYIESMNRQVKLDIQVGSGTIFIDPIKIKRVWNNLIDNGIKYSDADCPIFIRIAEQGGRVRFQVEDKGCGLEEEEQEKIFNIFFRGDHLEQSGYGLGLFIGK